MAKGCFSSTALECYYKDTIRNAQKDRDDLGLNGQNEVHIYASGS
jgi:hypothetical protein